MSKNFDGQLSANEMQYTHYIVNSNSNRNTGKSTFSTESKAVAKHKHTSEGAMSSESQFQYDDPTNAGVAKQSMTASMIRQQNK